MHRTVLPSLEVSRHKRLFCLHEINAVGEIEKLLERQVRKLDAKPLSLVKHEIGDSSWVISRGHGIKLVSPNEVMCATVILAYADSKSYTSLR